jgi:hypothetical protein
LEVCIYSLRIDLSPQSKSVDVLVTKHCSICLNTSRIYKNVCYGDEVRRCRDECECIRITAVRSLTDYEITSLRLTCNAGLDENVGRSCGERKSKHFARNYDLKSLCDTSYPCKVCQCDRELDRMRTHMADGVR